MYSLYGIFDDLSPLQIQNERPCLKTYCQHLKVQLCEDRNLKRNLRPSALSESGMGNPRGPTQLLLTQNCWQLCER